VIVSSYERLIFVMLQRTLLLSYQILCCTCEFRLTRIYNSCNCVTPCRYTRVGIGDDVATYLALIAHWLCYFNSAINPVIYNLMSGNTVLALYNLASTGNRHIKNISAISREHLLGALVSR
jgi:hypothetical protein